MASNMEQAALAFKLDSSAVKVELTTSRGIRYEILRNDLDIVHSETIDECQVAKAKLVYATGAKKKLNWQPKGIQHV